MSKFIRKVKTKSGATAVQIVTKYGRNVIDLDHIGSAKDPQRLEFLISLAKEKIHENQMSLFPEERPPIILQTKTHSKYLFDQLLSIYQRLHFNQISDEIFAHLVVARLIEPTSKLDTIRVLGELGLTPPSKDKIYRCLQKSIKNNYRSQLATLCFQASNLKQLSLILYDVTTLYFEIQKEDAFRKPGLSKERRLEPQVVVGLLVDRSGFPLELHEFEGNVAETKTIIPVITSFCQRHQLSVKQLTVTADAGMLSAKNLQELEAVGFSFVVGSRIAKTPYQIKEYQKSHPDEVFVDGQIFETAKTFGYKKEDRVERRVIYQYKKKRAQLDLKNIDKQISKAQRIVSGKVPLKKAAFVKLSKTKPSLNQDLIQEHKLRAGIKGYVTNLPSPKEDPKGISAQEIINAYHQLFQVEKSFRMSKTDLKARPIFHRKLDSIRAHLTIVFAALAIARFIEGKTNISIRKFIRKLKVIQSGTVTIEGKNYQTQPFIPTEIKTLVSKLGGH